MPPIERARGLRWRCSPSSRTPRPRATRRSTIEGYTPPRDPRADGARWSRPIPACIEVNVHPAPHVARARRRSTTTLYEEARQARLGDREVHARRPPHRHRRRQSRDARRRDARRQSAAAPARICCEASSPTGRTIRRCRTCSRARSSARPARRRAWTRRATTASTSSRSRSSRWSAQHAARQAKRCSPGSSTGCCATC